MRILYDAVGLVAGRPVALQTKPNALHQQLCFVFAPQHIVSEFMVLCCMTCYKSAVVCSHAIIPSIMSLHKQQVEDPALLAKGYMHVIDSSFSTVHSRKLACKHIDTFIPS